LPPAMSKWEASPPSVPHPRFRILLILQPPAHRSCPSRQPRSAPCGTLLAARSPHPTLRGHGPSALVGAPLWASLSGRGCCLPQPRDISPMRIVRRPDRWRILSTRPGCFPLPFGERARVRGAPPPPALPASSPRKRAGSPPTLPRGLAQPPRHEIGSLCSRAPQAMPCAPNHRLPDPAQRGCLRRSH